MIAEDRAYSSDPMKHQGLVRKIALKYVDKGLSLDDLIAEGQVGLMRASKGYERSFGVKFITYAYPHITKAITRAIELQVPLVSVPVNIQHRIRYEASNAKCSARHISYGLKALRGHVNEGDLGPKDRKMCLELIAVARPDSSLARCLAKHDLEILMRFLPEDEYEVLCLRYGLFGREEIPVAEIAKRLGKFPQWIYVLEARAIERLKSRVSDEPRSVPA